MTINEYKVEIEKSEIVYKGFLQLVRHTLKHSLFGGGWSQNMTREVLERKQAVAVLLHDINRDEIVLVEQFRVGALNNKKPWLLELVAGLVEAGETAEDVARREAAEESGATVTDLKQIAQYYGSAGGSNEITTVFYAEIDSTDIAGVHGVNNENEDILVRKFSGKEFVSMLDAGELNTASLVIAAQWFKSEIHSKY